MALSPYPIDPALTAIAIAYKNEDYIADAVLPRIHVNKQKFTWLEYPIDTNFNTYDTRVGRKSRPNEIQLSATEQTDSTIDHALRGGVPRADIENADGDPRYDPLGHPRRWGVMGLPRISAACDAVLRPRRRGSVDDRALPGRARLRAGAFRDD